MLEPSRKAKLYKACKAKLYEPTHVVVHASGTNSNRSDLGRVILSGESIGAPTAATDRILCKAFRTTAAEATSQKEKDMHDR